MNNVGIFSKLKVFEIVKALVNNYSYKEVVINKVEGVFLENRGNEWTLIRVSDQKFNSVEEFNADLELMRKVEAQYKHVSGMNSIKILCIYFGGYIVEQVDNIYSITINDNQSMFANTIINQNFPALTRVNLDQIDQMMSLDTQSQSGESKPIINLVNPKDLLKKIAFTRIFLMLFVAINLIFVFLAYNPQAFVFETSYYSVFFSELHQYYRPLSSLFLNSNFLYIIMFAYLFMRYSAQAEMALGTKKMTTIFITSCLFVLLTMVCLVKGEAVSGSFPLIMILIGIHCGLLTFNLDKQAVMNNAFNTLFLVALGFLISSLNFLNIATGAIGFFIAMAMTMAMNYKDKPIKKAYLAGIGLIAIAIVGFSFLPQKVLARDSVFEKNYITYVKAKDKKQGESVQKTIDDYYHKLGVVDYD